MLFRVLAIAMTTMCLLSGPSLASAQVAVGATAGAAESGAAAMTPGAESIPPAAPRIGSDEAAREIQRRHGGRVLSIQPDGLGYRVKVLKNGEVRIYQINP